MGCQGRSEPVPLLAQRRWSRQVNCAQPAYFEGSRNTRLPPTVAQQWHGPPSLHSFPHSSSHSWPDNVVQQWPAVKSSVILMTIQHCSIKRQSIVGDHFTGALTSSQVDEEERRSCKIDAPSPPHSSVDWRPSAPRGRGPLVYRSATCRCVSHHSPSNVVRAL